MRKLRYKLVILCVFAYFCVACTSSSHSVDKSNQALQLGIDRSELYLPILANKKVGLVVNQSSIKQHQHLVDFLLANKVDVRVLFAPEHGIRGRLGAGETVDNSVDPQSGVLIQSIYGQYKTPPDNIMKALDVIVFDIQDVGTRFYTYISSMHYMMQAAADHQLEFVVLDRPNPNGAYVDGPVLDLDFQSFVGMHPIPVLHGLTVAELALMIKGENWLDNAAQLRLHIIPMLHYHKQMPFSLPIAPSPNLPNDQAISLYPSLCFFEATAVSVGRGTDFPFQVIGHDTVPLGKFAFTPLAKPNAAPNPKLKGQQAFGIDLRQSAIQGLDLSLLISAHAAFKKNNTAFFTAPAFMDKLAGTDQLRLQIEAGYSEAQITQSWQPALLRYEQMRAAYLVYPETPER